MIKRSGQDRKDETSVRASLRAASSWSACSGRKGSGGLILSTWPRGPVALMRTRRSRIPLTMAAGCSAAGSPGDGAAHVGEHGRACRDPGDPVLEVGAGGGGVGGERVGVEDVEDGGGGGDADGVAAEGVEVPGVAAEVVEYVLPGDEPGDGEAVAHRLAHGDDVGGEAVPLVAPHAGPGAGEAGLDLVGDIKAAGRVHDLGDGGEEPGGVGEHAVGGKTGGGEEPRQPHAGPLQAGDGARYA